MHNPLAAVYLNEERNLPNIDCFGSAISYTCSIMTNAEYLHLVWRVNIPHMVPMSVVYLQDTSINTTTTFTPALSATLMTIAEGFIQSVIEFIPQSPADLSYNGTTVECSIANLANNTVILSAPSLGTNMTTVTLDARGN